MTCSTTRQRDQGDFQWGRPRASFARCCSVRIGAVHIPLPDSPVSRGVRPGLSFIHSRGVCHRDVSPENVFMTGELVAKIGDFGASIPFLPGGLVPAVGGCKPNWSAPEMFGMEDYDGVKCDVYPVGAIFFTLLTGCTSPCWCRLLPALRAAHARSPRSVPPYREPQAWDAQFQMIARGQVRQFIRQFVARGMAQAVPPMHMNLLEGLLCVDPKKRSTVDAALGEPVIVAASGDVRNELV